MSLPIRAKGLATSGYDYIVSALGSNFKSPAAGTVDLDVVCDSPGPVIFQIESPGQSNLYTVSCDGALQSAPVDINEGDNVVTINAREKFADVKWQISAK